MVQFLSNVKVNASFLPPVKSYEMWLNPKAAANYDTGVDPCPDCDVRFHEDQSKPVLADTSILGIFFRNLFLKRMTRIIHPICRSFS